MISNYHNWRKSRDNRVEHVNRGCPSCHNVRQLGPQQTLDLRLGAVVNRMEGHPQVPVDSAYTDCKECHRPGGRSEFMLRTLVHPIHLNSAIFLENYRGNCFTCHDVNAEGKFKVLGKPLEVNERGIPTHSPFEENGIELRKDLH
jgi:cytochrome c2